MAKNNSIISIGFPGLLTIVLITLKLTGKINWSWWWVFSPSWISAALFLIVMAIVLVAVLLSNED